MKNLRSFSGLLKYLTALKKSQLRQPVVTQALTSRAANFDRTDPPKSIPRGSPRIPQGCPRIPQGSPRIPQGSPPARERFGATRSAHPVFEGLIQRAFIVRHNLPHRMALKRGVRARKNSKMRKLARRPSHIFNRISEIERF